MLGLEELLDQQKPTAGVSGRWFTAQWMPDPAAGERLNIGVGFITDDGERLFQFADDFTRLKCLYDQSAVFHAQLACRFAEEFAYSDDFAADRPYANIFFEERGFAQGADLNQIVNRLFRETVTLAREHRTSRKREFVPVPRMQAYTRLKSQLRKRLQANFQKYVPEDPYVRVADQFGDEKLYLPFRRDNGIATLATAAYADSHRVKANLFEGYRAVETAMHHGLGRDAAVFLVLPGDNLRPDVKTSVENEIDNFYSFLRRHHIRMESHQNIDSLGEEIAEWCSAA